MRVIDCADNHCESNLANAAQRLGLYRQNFEADVIGMGELNAWLDRTS